jgi:DNA mismatch repair protein MutL
VSRVHVLPDDLANQIAAGEVIERPSSVVKELVENALDAGARRISIDIEGGGLILMRVADDGVGMDREDARLAPLRHATSKITDIDDLTRIASFGFRGEALPSIASVSRFSLRTRRREDTEGTEVRIEGGGAMTLLPCGSAAGTVVEVRDLFFNLPARRKFLKAVGTESAHITEVAQAAAFCEPAVTVILSRDGRTVREWLRASCREERARAAFPGEEMAVCRGQRGPLTVEAFVSRPERARSGAMGLSIFVNGRPVRDRGLARAVANAYGSVLEPGRYPLGAVYLDLPHELIDVNVHPQKAEVRFADSRAIFNALYRIVGDALSAAFGLPSPGAQWQRRPSALDEAATPVGSGRGGQPAGEDPWIWSSAPPIREENGDRQGMGVGAGAGMGAGTRAEAGTESQSDVSSPLFASVVTLGASPSAQDTMYSPFPGAAPISIAEEIAPRSGARQIPFDSLRFVAQVRRTFLICESPDGLYILDQHAAAERVTFDRLRRAFRSRGIAAQQLLFPSIVEVSAIEAALVDEAQDEITRAGFELRGAGPTSVAVHAIPSLLSKAQPERLVKDLLGEISRAGERAVSGAIDLALATMACHGSVRAGDLVGAEEATALLAALDEVDFAGHCPHGRPIVMRIGWGELEHRVGRR